MKNKTALYAMSAAVIVMIVVIFSSDHTLQNTLHTLGLSAFSGGANIKGTVIQPIKPMVVNFSEIAAKSQITNIKKPVVSDNIPPKISFAFPSQNSNVSDTVTIKVNVSDNVGVAYVSYFLDGNQLGSSKIAPFSYAWDTTNISGGSHSLKAVAYDFSGNFKSVVEKVSVYNKGQPKKRVGNPHSILADFGGPGGTSVCDCNIAVGPSNVVTVDNYNISIYNKTGTLVTPAVSLVSFFDPTNALQITGSSIGSARAYYDEKSQKFFVTDVASSPVPLSFTRYYTFLAVSQTSDPTGNWWVYPLHDVYDVTAFNTSLFEGSYPQLGMNASMVVISEHQVSAGKTLLFIIDKSTVTTGSAAIFSVHNGSIVNQSDEQPWPPLTDEQQLAPAREYDDNNPSKPLPIYLIARSGNGIVVYSISGPAVSATFSLVGTITGPNSKSIGLLMIPVPEPSVGGNDYFLDANGDSTVYHTNGFINDPILRNNSLFFAYDVEPTTGPFRVSVYWGQIDMSAVPSGGLPVFVQDGLAADDPTGNINYFYPTLAVNQCDDVGIGFSGSSLSTFPSAYYTSRAWSDSVGYMSVPTLGKAGLSTYSTNIYRNSSWGYYSGAHVDPTDNSFWTFEPITPAVASGKTSSSWTTWINNFSVPSSAVTPIFTTNYANGTSGVPNATGLYSPDNVLYDSVNSRIFVADSKNNRVMIYTDKCGQYTATAVLGQPNFTSSYQNYDGTNLADGATPSQYGFNEPIGLAYDSADGYLFVSDEGNNRVEVFDVNPGTMTAEGEQASYELGQQAGPNAFTVGPVNQGGSANASSLWDPRGLLYDNTNSILYTVDRQNNRVLAFDMAPSGSRTLCGTSSPGLANGMSASCVLGQQTMTANDVGLTNTGLWGPQFAAIDNTNHYLYVSDTGSSRVVGYPLTNGLPTTGEQANIVLGQSNFTSQAANEGSTPSKSSLYVPYGLAYDQTRNLLFVSDPGINGASAPTNNRIMVFDMSSPPTTNMNASYVIGQPNFTSYGADAGQAGPNAQGLHGPFGISLDPNGNLYVAEQLNNRITIFNTSTISTYPSAVNEIGQ